ncbi:MAG: DUF4190 domain-containing protein [Akkermansiaceae bacterium]|nr:DUF4190 domain-containing protein [Akkermansiaceae bacterium]
MQASAPTQQPPASKQAVWSLVLGILSITCLWIFGSIPAIVLGVLAKKNIARSGGQLGGGGMATAGIITGSVGIFVGVGALIIFSLTMPVFTRIQESAKISKEISKARQVLLGCKAYASDYEGKYPPNLKTLMDEGYVDVESVLMWTDPRTGEELPFLYRPGLTDSTRGIEPVIASPRSAVRKRIVGYTGGHVTSFRDAEFDAEIAPLFEGSPAP